MSTHIAPLTVTTNVDHVFAVAAGHNAPMFRSTQLLPLPTGSPNEQRYAVMEHPNMTPESLVKGGTLRRGLYEKVEATSSPIGPIKRFNFSEQLRVPVVLQDANGNTVYEGVDYYTVSGSNLLTGSPIDAKQRAVVWAHLQRLVNLYHYALTTGELSDDVLRNMAFGVLELPGAGEPFTGTNANIDISTPTVTNVV